MLRMLQPPAIPNPPRCVSPRPRSPTSHTPPPPPQGQHPVNEARLLPGAEKRQHRAPKKYSPGREARAEQRLREQARAAAAAPIDLDGWQVRVSVLGACRVAGSMLVWTGGSPVHNQVMGESSWILAPGWFVCATLRQLIP